MSLRIACDLDGTLADMNSALQREAEYLFGEGVDVCARPRPVPSRAVQGRSDSSVEEPDADGVARRRPLDSRERSQLWSRVGKIDNFWETLEEIEPGTVLRLAGTAASRGWELLFLTQRPDTAGSSTQVQSQRWLRAHGFELPSVYVVSGSRGKVAAALALDAVVDDRPENCLDVTSDSSAAAVLVWRHGAEGLPPGVSRLQIHVVSSMTAAIDHLAALQAHTAAPRRLFSRLRRALRRP